MKRRGWLWVAGLAAAALLTAAILARQPAEQQTISRYSSYDAGPLGLRALYLTLHDLGYRPERLRWPASPLTLRRKGTLICLDPVAPIMPAEWRAMRQWVARGYLLVVSPAGYWLRDIDATASQRAAARPSQPSFLSRGVEALRVLRRSREGEWLIPGRRAKGPPQRKRRDEEIPLMLASPVFLAEGVPLFAEGRASVVEYVKHGEGGMIVLKSPWTFSNSGLGQADNLRFALNAVGAFAGSGRWVGFDEYHQGYAESPLWGLAPLALKGALAVLLVAAALFLIAVSRRLGAPLPSPEPGSRTRDEYLTSMSGLLERAGASEVALRASLSWFCDRAGLALGIGRARQAEEVIQAARQQGNRASDDIERVVSDCRGAIAGGRVAPSAAVALVQRMHDIIETLWAPERAQPSGALPLTAKPRLESFWHPPVMPKTP